MLAVSDNAAQAIEAILEHEQAPEGAGLRIGVVQDNGGGPAIGVGLAAGPQPTDQVVEKNGASVFVEDELSEPLDDKVLDTHVEGEQIAFTVREQGDL